MRRFAVGLAVLALPPAAAAAPPAVTASASPASGLAPLRVTLTAAGDAATYTWDLGDGATATGPMVSHVYGAGRHVATVTAAGPDGETAQAQIVVVATARTLTLEAPASGEHGAAVALRGALRPVGGGRRVQIYRGRTYVTSATVAPDGRFRTTIRLRSPGPYEARLGATRSPARTIVIRPRLVVTAPATLPLGAAGAVRARLEPAGAGEVRLRLLDGRRPVAQRTRAGSAVLALPAGRERTFRVVAETVPRPGYAGARQELQVQVVAPRLAPGSRGPSVRTLERRLAELRYALRGVDGRYGPDTTEAVLAFQKVHGLPRTGRVDAAVWRRLAAAAVPLPRHGGADHVEVDKTRNVLYEIVGGQVHRIVHVSTGATGNTPLGTFPVYRKVPGWDWVLWYPLYFLRGFAIHGYPSVPAYPASHGCVRVPMWIAPSIFARFGHGSRVVVYA